VLHRPGVLWEVLAMLLGVGALLGGWAPASTLDWQPGLVASEPWRAWSAAFVHWSAWHLGVNLLGCALVGALGRAAALPVRATLAWCLAWPLGHLGLLTEPGLAHYGGLSGVLHAGVAVAGCWLAVAARGRPRAIGLAMLTGLAIKIVLEDPFGEPLVHPGGWDIAIAPRAHATGALAGAVAAGIALIGRRQSAG
jgi:rhomboid family GlyGly-CTERM serine protease